MSYRFLETDTSMKPPVIRRWKTALDCVMDLIHDLSPEELRAVEDEAFHLRVDLAPIPNDQRDEDEHNYNADIGRSIERVERTRAEP